MPKRSSVRCSLRSILPAAGKAAKFRRGRDALPIEQQPVFWRYDDKRGTDTDDPFTNLGVGRVAERQRVKLAVRVNFNDSIISDSISDDAFGFENPSVEQLDKNFFRFADDMLAGQDITSGMEDKSRTEAALKRRRRFIFVIDEAADEGIDIFGKGGVFGNDGDDSLLNSLYNRNKKVERMQTAAAHRVLYTRILGPSFTFQQPLPLQQ